MTEHLGILAIAVNWVGLLFLIRKWPGNVSMTFSQHAGKHTSAAIYYAVLWTICLPPFYWWLVGPFADRLSLGAPFYVMSTIAAIGMAVAALVPEIGTEPYTRIHRIAAFTMAYLFMPINVYIGWTASLSTVAYYMLWAGVAFMLYWTLISLKDGRVHEKMLLIQASYTLVFQIGIFAAFYL